MALQSLWQSHGPNWTWIMSSVRDRWKSQQGLEGEFGGKFGGTLLFFNSFSGRFFRCILCDGKWRCICENGEVSKLWKLCFFAWRFTKIRHSSLGMVDWPHFRMVIWPLVKPETYILVDQEKPHRIGDAACWPVVVMVYCRCCLTTSRFRFDFVLEFHDLDFCKNNTNTLVVVSEVAGYYDFFLNFQTFF